MRLPDPDVPSNVGNEILRVERTGLPLLVFSYRRPVENVQHENVRQIKPPIHYLPDPLWKSLGLFLLRGRDIRRLEPALFGKTLAYVARASLRDRSLDVWKRLLQAFYLASELRSQNVTHLHAHFAHEATQVAMLASLLSGISFSFTGHAKDVYTARQRNLTEEIHHAGCALTCTGVTRDYLRSLAAQSDAEKVSLAYHGVDTNKFAPGEADAQEGLPLILPVGRLVEKKGFRDLVEALRLLKERGIAFRAEVVGGGPDRKKLERLRDTAGLRESLLFAGPKSREELVEDYRRASIFVLPSVVTSNGDRDGIPNVLMEAMAVGVPVISTNLSGIPELVRNGGNGILVEQRDPNALSAAIDRLISDPDLRQRLASAGRQSVLAEFDVDAMAAQLAAMFCQTRASGAEKAPHSQPHPAT